MITSAIIPRPLARLPWRLIFLVSGIAGFGLVVLYSAAGGSPQPWALKQAMVFGFFLALAIGMSWLPEGRMKAVIFPVYGVILIMLIGVEILGFASKGAQRWLEIGPVRLQPSEFMKPAIVLIVYLVLSTWLAIVTDIEQYTTAVIWVAILAVLVGWLYLRYRRWQDWFFIMTDKNIILLEMHPEWLWWLTGDDPRLPVQDVRFIKVKDMGAMGNSLNYGILQIDGLTSLDVDYNDVPYVPDHHTVGKFAMMLVNANKSAH